MKAVSWICLFALLPLQAAGQTPDSTQSHELDDVVVQETFEDTFSEDKFPVHFDLDFSNVIEVGERMNWKSIDALYAAAVPRRTTVMALRLASPEFAHIQPAPVKRFFVKLNRVTQWRLDIVSNQGTLFRQISGQGNPPAVVTWDGLSDDGEPLVAGHNYSYTLTAVDKAGNRRTFTGKTFLIPAFYLRQGATLLVGISFDLLFHEDGFRLRPVATELAQEVASLVRLNSQKARISYASTNPNVATFLKLLADELVVDTSQLWHIQTDTLPADCLYFYIE